MYREHEHLGNGSLPSELEKDLEGRLARKCQLKSKYKKVKELKRYDSQYPQTVREHTSALMIVSAWKKYKNNKIEERSSMRSNPDEEK